MKEARDPSYFLAVTAANGQQILTITGKRNSVIEAALMAITDGAIDWQEASRWPRPHFRIDCTEIR